jgi:hypothetical protein
MLPERGLLLEELENERVLDLPQSAARPGKCAIRRVSGFELRRTCIPAGRVRKLLEHLPHGREEVFVADGKAPADLLCHQLAP